MKHEPLLKQVLGNDWNKLSPAIRKHYDLSETGIQRCTVTGQMEVDYPPFLTPLIKLIHLFGGLVDIKGKKVETQVEKWVQQDSPFLHWRRSLQDEQGRQTVFASKMVYHGENELIELIKHGFGLRLKISQKDGDLIYQSNGHLLKLAGINIPIPDWLVLGHAHIAEHALSDDSFQLKFVIHHPLWGESYRYGGIFKIHNS